MAKREYERTCKRCSTVWYAPIETAPNRMQIGGHRMQATGERLSMFGGRKAASHELRANALEAKRDRVLAAQQCPGCGSQAYKQRIVKIK